jgi:hypothetical protein
MDLARVGEMAEDMWTQTKISVLQVLDADRKEASRERLEADR